MQIKPLYDEYGVIYEAFKILPLELRNSFLEILAELENNECHRTQKFPKTNLHKVKGYEEPVYRAYIDKVSGWRLHIMYENGAIHLKDIIPGQLHDPVIKVIQSKEYRYKKKQEQKKKDEKK